MPSILFYIFSAIAVFGALALVFFRNPVSSALAMVVSFLGLAVLFVGLNAYFVGVIQVLVYTGAIMVLFLFIIMLLDLKAEEKVKLKPIPIAAAFIIPNLFILQLTGVLKKTPDLEHTALPLAEAAAEFETNETIKASLEKGSLPDVHLIGQTMFTEYNFPFQIIGVLLLVATVGVVVLSKRQTH